MAGPRLTAQREKYGVALMLMACSCKIWRSSCCPTVKIWHGDDFQAKVSSTSSSGASLLFYYLRSNYIIDPLVLFHTGLLEIMNHKFTLPKKKRNE